MPLQVRYDQKHDILTVWTGDPIVISSSADGYSGLVVDFGSQDEQDVVGFELRAAAKLLSPVLQKMTNRGVAN